MVAALLERGWARFPAEAALRDWARAALDIARARLADPDWRARWLVCEGTWFVGVDALPNDETGDFGAGSLGCAALSAAHALYGELPLHPGQLSAVFPGYPRPRAGESQAAFRYRQTRDAAHVDGLLATGPDRRRKLVEPHAWILGLPLTACSPDASPLSLWEGSHHLLRAAFEAALVPHPESAWPQIDLTETYHAARREAFASCRRITLSAQPGEAYLLHRHCLHGIAPWAPSASAPPEGRIIAYFRPEFPPGTRAWLDRP